MDLFIQQLVDKNRGCDVKELINRERESRKERVRRSFFKAFEDSEENGKGFELLRYYAMLAVGENTALANEKIYEIITSEDEEVIRRNTIQDKWSLWINPMFIRMYMYFGTQGSGVLSRQNEDLILKMLWERMLYKNDINLAEKSTWHLTGSENHDLNFKVCCLLTSQIFKDLPEYKNRIYPDTGKGAGSGYWFHYMYDFMGGDKSDYGPEGRADESEATEYNAQTHYDAWCRFLKEYIRERAKRGFFLEASATGYMKWTLSFIALLIEFCEDEELKHLAKKFYDLIWCEWAQEQLCGRRGGAKTRFVFEDWQIENDSMYFMASFWLGGDCDASFAYYFQLLLDYELPEFVWDMLINPPQTEGYEYISRRPGEEEMLFPRPYGNERTMICSPVSRMVHYSFVTSNYILGTQFDHPYMLHSHLSMSNRWNGLLLGSMPDSYVFPTAFAEKNGQLRPCGKMYRSVQYKNVLICGQNLNFFKVNPEWFPLEENLSAVLPYGFYFGKEFDICKKGEWYIFEDSECFVALRPAYGGAEFKDKRNLLFNKPMSPAIIHVESSKRFKNKEEFYGYLCNDCEFKLNNTVVPGYYTIDYSLGTTQLYYNAANNEPPRINGELIDYECPYTFKSPYIESEYGSGIINITKDGKSAVLDFN